METSFHSLNDLFDQLGLASSPESIDQFIKKYSPLNSTVVLEDANFWNPYQRQFLRDELQKDADWAEPIDLLNSQLRIP